MDTDHWKENKVSDNLSYKNKIKIHGRNIFKYKPREPRWKEVGL